MAPIRFVRSAPAWFCRTRPTTSPPEARRSLPATWFVTIREVDRHARWRGLLQNHRRRPGSAIFGGCRSVHRRRQSALESGSTQRRHLPHRDDQNQTRQRRRARKIHWRRYAAVGDCRSMTNRPVEHPFSVRRIGRGGPGQVFAPGLRRWGAVSAGADTGRRPVQTR